MADNFHPMGWLLATAMTLAAGVPSLPLPAQESSRNPDIPILVMNATTLGVSRLAAQRIPIGMPGDYKPCIARMPDGELLLVLFHGVQLGGGKIREDIIFYRSPDGGVTWSERRVLDTLLGREPYLTVLKDGTTFITVHLLSQDVRNKDGYVHSYIHRSTDGGKTWTTTRIGPEGFPPRAETVTSRKVLELPDGTLLLGVSANLGGDFIWRSTDRGQTWDRSLRCDTGFPSAYLFSEAVLWGTESGKILSIIRVDSRAFPIPGRPAPPGKLDDQDHMILCESRNLGRSWWKVEDFGDYGEHYPSVLRLKDGRLLLTFTVRDLKWPLGLQAVLGREKDDGFQFDFQHDRLVLDAKTPPGMSQGGGFGPTVQLDDGTLVTSYSYRGKDDTTHVEVVRWNLPAPRT